MILAEAMSWPEAVAWMVFFICLAAVVIAALMILKD